MIGTIQPENSATLALAMRQVNVGEFLSSCMLYVANYSIWLHCCCISVMLKLEHQLVYIWLYTGYSISSLAWDYKNKTIEVKPWSCCNIAVCRHVLMLRDPPSVNTSRLRFFGAERGAAPLESRSCETEQVPQYFNSHTIMWCNAVKCI